MLRGRQHLLRDPIGRIRSRQRRAPRRASTPSGRGRRGAPRPHAAAAARPARRPAPPRPRRPPPSSGRSSTGGPPVACGYGTRIDGRPAAAQLEDRSARARRREVRGGQAVGERLRVGMEVVVRRVAERLEAAARSSSWSRTPLVWRTAHGASRPNASTAAKLSERAPSEPPNTSRQGSLGSMPNRSRAAARSAFPVAAGTGRPDHRVALTLATCDRERQEHSPRDLASSRFVTPRWLSASVRSSGTPSERAASAHRPRDVPAAPEHGVGADAAQEPARAHDRRACQCRRAALREAGCAGRARRPRGGGTGSPPPARAPPRRARRRRTRRARPYPAARRRRRAPAPRARRSRPPRSRRASRALPLHHAQPPPGRRPAGPAATFSTSPIAASSTIRLELP